MFDGIHNILLINFTFEHCIALQGSAMACIHGGSDYMLVDNVTFVDNESTSLNYTTLDIYSDGSCDANFWNSQFPCPIACNSCNVSKLIYVILF